MNLKEMQAARTKLHAEVKALVSAGDMGDDYKKKDGELALLETQIKAMSKLEDNTPPDLRTGIPLGTDTPSASNETKALELKALREKNVNVLRYGDIDASQDMILGEVYDDDWRNLFAKQDDGFKSFLRVAGHLEQLPTDVVKAGKRRLVDVVDVIQQLKDGLSVAEIKATMVAGTDVLGGYAVPPQRARQILSEVMGMTAVRRAGALVIRTTSTQIEWLRITGGTTGQYPGALRGTWTGETASPGAQNLTFGTQTITTSLYTYKVPMSVTLLQTAQNIVPILQQQIAETLAIDEDLSFLYGDGVNGPRGILIGGAPDDGISVLTSGSSATFTIDDLKAVRRQVATRYRMAGRGVYVFNSATGNHIETMKDGEGRFYFDAVGEGQPVFGAPTHESEALPDIASSSYPLIYGDMRGYAIVEAGPGLEIFRFMDSNTGPNVVEFHVRRRLGGKVIEPYRLAALRCGA